MKKILVLISVLLVSTGFVLTQSDQSTVSSGQKPQENIDTAYAKPDLSPDETQDTLTVQDAPRSNLLLKKGENGGFSLVSLLRGLLGLFVLVFIAWLFSTKRSAID